MTKAFNTFRKSQLLAVALFSTLALISCNKDEDGDEVDCALFEWGYEGEEASDFWGHCYTDCSGSAQSPVNITGASADASLKALEMHYEAVPIELINNGHTVEFEYESGSTLVLNGATYELIQFHFHTGSEHTVSGKQYAMEAHLVHKNATTGNLAVVGILIEEGTENAFLKHFNGHLPAKKDDHYSNEEKVDVKDLLPSGKSYYTYSGSLTTPPCSEVVTWFVMKEPVKASKAQIDAFHAIMHENYRPIQSLKGRTIKQFS